jgi:hypothetical protein
MAMYSDSLASQIALLMATKASIDNLEINADLKPIVFSLRITLFLNFVHRPIFDILENTTFRELDLFPSSGEGGETLILLGALERIYLSQSID